MEDQERTHCLVDLHKVMSRTMSPDYFIARWSSKLDLLLNDDDGRADLAEAERELADERLSRKNLREVVNDARDTINKTIAELEHVSGDLEEANS